MKLAIATQTPPLTRTPPFIPPARFDASFAAASTNYTDAIRALTIAPNERKSPELMVAAATEAALKAVTVLQGPLNGGNIFEQRTARGSLTQASTGLDLLSRTAPQHPPTNPLSFGEAIPAARNAFIQAEKVLWYE